MPLGTTSTDAMDTEEAQEFSKEIAEAVVERELKKQKYEQFDILAAKLSLPYEKPLTTYPSFGNLMDAIQQENMEVRNREYF